MKTMQIELKMDPACQDPKIIIVAASMNGEVQDILKRLSEGNPWVLSGIREGKLEVLDPAQLIRIYAGSGKVFAVTDSGEYVLRLRLYELEEKLDRSSFVRISNSEIINLKKVKNFDLSFTGTICVKFQNGMTTYVSRRYVSKIKQILGV